MPTLPQTQQKRVSLPIPKFFVGRTCISSNLALPKKSSSGSSPSLLDSAKGSHAAFPHDKGSRNKREGALWFRPPSLHNIYDVTSKNKRPLPKRFVCRSLAVSTRNVIINRWWLKRKWSNPLKLFTLYLETREDSKKANEGHKKR